MQTELKPRAPRAGASTGSPDDRVAVLTGGATGIGLTAVRPAAAEPSGGTIRRGPSPRTVLAVAALGGAVAYIDATIVNIAFPDIARSFPGTSLSALSWVLNAYNIVFAAFLMAAAGIADSLGRRRVFVFGLGLFTVGSLLCAIAPSAGALIAFRVVQALGAACLVPSALALVLNAFPPAHRRHGVALLSAVGAAAAGFGPSLGGLLVTAANWRLVFLVNVPVGVAAALLARRRLVESRAPGRRRIPDLPGTLLFAIAIGALVLGIVKGHEWGWGSAPVIGLCSLALVTPSKAASRMACVPHSVSASNRTCGLPPWVTPNSRALCGVSAASIPVPGRQGRGADDVHDRDGLGVGAGDGVDRGQLADAERGDQRADARSRA